ncbi:MAG: hypothetical protein HYV68_02595 [Candidatus Taylorbacteria bacterium]|nr:hypothetical protein [Candidatus Taylorbacteria bacterium]
MQVDNTKEVRLPLRNSEKDFVLEDGPRCLIFERAWKYQAAGHGPFPFEKILLPEDFKLVEGRLEVAA